MESRLELLGRWPVPGPEARSNKEMVLVPAGETLDFIHGRENPVLVSFSVSNDFVHVGKMTIPANGSSDPETHKGDEVILCLQGTLSVLPLEEDDGEEPVSVERHEVRVGERFFIPEGVRHRYFNFTGDVCQFLFSIAPEL